MYYLMKYENKKSFVFMLVSAEGGRDMDELLKGQKRDTDLVFPIHGIEGSNTLFALIC